jgi:serine/threonine-protein kinase RsbW
MPSDPNANQDLGDKNRRLSVALNSVSESVNVAESLIVEFSKQGFVDQQYAIRLAVREGMVNAIMHGNRFDACKNVFFSAEIDAERLLISIRDEGDGCDPDSAPHPLAASNFLRDSGRGIFLMRAFMDEVTWQGVAGGGTELRMIKRRLEPGGESE